MNKVWDLFGMDSAEPEGYEDENIYDYDNNEEEETEDNNYIKQFCKFIKFVHIVYLILC